MRIAIATDAWFPQTNGVVRSLATTVSILQRRGYEIELITPDQFVTIPTPGYSEIRLAVAPRFGVRRALARYRPDIVHIVTEGPIGWAARAWCLANRMPFTTAFHTRFPDYAAVRTGLSPDRFWPIMRRFHRPSSAVLVSTYRLMDELAQRGIDKAQLWSRGIDKSLFHPGHEPLSELAELPRPILLYVGRVAPEKNISDFLGAAVAGTKVVVGDGPAMRELEARFPDARFLGALHGEHLARAYCSADVFVFPSTTDTFGLVLIEALACGIPVAAYPVQGPLDILGVSACGIYDQLSAPAGALDSSLSSAITKALGASRKAAAQLGASFDWEKCSDQFVEALRHSMLSAQAKPISASFSGQSA
jgi:glycosyltransferase involved in cell wall biosynthesis